MTIHTVNEASEPLPEQGLPPTGGPGRGVVRGLEILNDAGTALLISVGHQTGLFDTMADLPASTSGQIAAAAVLDERYVREWLGGLTSAGLIDHDPATETFVLPTDYAAVLTRAAGPNNIAFLLQYVAMMGEVEQKIIDCFHHGGGLTYADYPRFHHTMAEASGAVFDAALVGGILPMVPRLPSRLQAGIDVADIGCGSGHAINVMAAAYPASTFTGYDFSEWAIERARAEAEEAQLTNVKFVLTDVASLDEEDRYDFITAFDAIHDQAHPAAVLVNIRRALRDDGHLLMVEFNTSSNVEDNVGLPWGAFLHAMSTFHCLSVSLGLNGVGVGAAWGRQLACTMLKGAGLSHVEITTVPSDPFNAYFVASKG